MDGEGISTDELVRRLFDAFNSRDLDAALPLLHPDLVFEPITAAFLNDGQPYRGHEGIRLYFEHVTRHWRRLEINPVQIRAAGVAVVALGQTSGAGPGGEFSAVPTTWVFKFRDGLVAGIQIFSDERHASQALAREAQAAGENATEDESKRMRWLS